MSAEVGEKVVDETQQKEAAPHEIHEEEPVVVAQVEEGSPEIEEEGPKKLILRSGDGQKFEVDVAVLKASVMIQNMINDGCATGCVPLPNVMAAELAKLIEYLNHHAGADEDKMSEAKGWNGKFVDMDKDELFELIMAANYLEVKPLFELTCQTAANRIKDMTVEDVREYFDIENDFSPEEEAELREKNKWAFE